MDGEASKEKVKVTANARLHFGLIDLAGGLGRVDGSVGLTLAQPNVVVLAETSDETSLKGAGKRVSLIEKTIKQVSQRFNVSPNVELTVSEAIPEHSGLGSTTQLVLCVAKALTSLGGLQVPAPTLAACAGRGGTSGVGVWAFAQGGFLVDGGHAFGGDGKQEFAPSSYSDCPPPPLVARANFPGWHVVVAVPGGERGLHGPEELDFFRRNFPVEEEEADRLSRIVLLKLLPAVNTSDLAGFDEAVRMFNEARSFQPPDVSSRLCEEFSSLGGKATSVSSFGPAVFSFTGEAAVKDRLAEHFKSEYCGRVYATRAENKGATVEVAP